jgi:two-component system nitrate/nitrite response regulator NarL
MSSEKKSTRIRILVADANAMFCELLQGVFRRRRGFEVVACATGLRELVEGLENAPIDVALVSAHLKDGKNSGLKSVQHLRTIRPQIRSVVRIQESDKRLAIEAYRAGAKGVFPRSQADIHILAKCVDRVHA